MRHYDALPSGTVSRARARRRNSTDAERQLWGALREALPHAKFRRQVPVGPYFADFLSFSAGMIVEVDGGQHAEAAAYDARRTAFPNSEGFHVLRVWNNDALGNVEGVLTTIASHIPSPCGRGREPRSGGRVRADHASALRSPSPSHASHGPLPLPSGEGAEGA